MAKKPSTITLPSKQVPAVLTLPAMLAASATAPTAEEIEKAKAEKRNTEAIAAFEKSPLAAAAYHSKVDAIGAEAKRQVGEAATNATKMVEVVAALYVSAEWCTWPIHSLIGPYIEAKFGEDARNKYRVALKARCDALKVSFPTASDKSGNADKGKSPARKYAKAARAFDAAITAATEFYGLLSADAPSLAHWTTIMGQLRAVQVEMAADSKNDKLKKQA